MASDQNDRRWEALAKKDPYWAVATWEKFSGANLTDETRREFFQTGEDHVHFVLETIRRRFCSSFKPSSVLEFGCGVGRLLVPFAECGQSVVGVDVSATMLKEARKNCERRGLSNVQLHELDNLDFSSLRPFDLVHSFIVFQHVPPKRGKMLLQKLVDLVAPNGIGVLHFTYARKHAKSASRRFVGKVWRQMVARWAPSMEMYTYSINELLMILQQRGISRVHVELTDHNFYGALLFFQR